MAGKPKFDKSQIVRKAEDTTLPINKKYLRWLCEKGLEKLVFPKFEDPDFIHTEEEYRDRLDYELEVIEGMGYVDYFLIVQDYVNYARNNGIPTGPGRGSAAGCLVSYLTGITGVDPIPYGLYFERFLNPGRKGMPDIDVDFPQSKRQEIIEHIRQQYGNDKVAQIATFSYMAARGSVRDATRILGFPPEFGDKIAKMISDKPKAKIEDDLVQGAELYNFYHQNPDVKKVVDTAMAVEGLIRQGSIHASALVIAPVDITDKMPLQTPKKSQVSKAEEGVITEDSLLVQFDGPTVENMGYLKMDILGLGTLDVIENTLNFIKKTKGIHLTLDDIPFDDEKTFELLCAGDTNGVFQVESSGMKNVLKDIHPTKFEEIADIIALYRPGPMEYIPSYKMGKEDPSSIKYIVPELKPILESTYGIAVYQEQLMEVAKEIGGFTLAEADDLRKAISKKKYELLVKLEEKFYNGCRAKGIKDKTIAELWKLMEAASGYSFNKSHAFCYAVLSYYTGYLKANYTTEFMASLMTYKKDDQDAIKIYINDCKRYGIQVTLPNVNHSSIDFDITPSGDISFGLAALKGVGYGPASEIIENRQNNGAYKDLNDFIGRVKINSRVYEILAKSGALDNLGWSRKALVEEKDRVIKFAKEMRKTVDTGLQMGFDFFDEVDCATISPLSDKEYEGDYLLELENEMLGMYITGHPIEYYELSRRLKSKGMPQKHLYHVKDLGGLPDKEEVYVFGIVHSLRRYESKKGWMAFVTLGDFGYGDENYNGSMPKLYTFDVVLFTDAYSKWGYKMKENDFISIHGRMNLRKDNNNMSLIADDITFLLKDSEINYQNDNIMRKIVLDVMEEMKAEKEGLLPPASRELLENERNQETVNKDNSPTDKDIDLDEISKPLTEKREKKTKTYISASEALSSPVSENITSKDDSKEDKPAPEKERTELRISTTNDNYLDLLRLIKQNPGDLPVIAVFDDREDQLRGINLSRKVEIALDFAGLKILN